MKIHFTCAVALAGVAIIGTTIGAGFLYSPSEDDAVQLAQELNRALVEQQQGQESGVNNVTCQVGEDNPKCNPRILGGQASTIVP